MQDRCAFMHRCMNMKIFDLHADIGMDVLSKKLKGEQDILKTYHLDKLELGDILGVGMACFFEGHENWQTAQTMVRALREELEMNQARLHFYKGGSLSENCLNAMITIEGMCFIEKEPEAHLTWLYEQGARIGSLCWNDENALATGVKGNPLRGLSTLGKRAIQHMNRLNMIIDVSHTNEKSFWDVLETSSKPVIATHSNTRHLSNVDRNLTEQQIKALIQKEGLIGLVAARWFVSKDESNQTANQLALHAAHIKALGGIDHLAIGFDYMDFLEGNYGRASMASDLQDASESQNLIQALRNVGFSEEEIKKVAWDNVKSFLCKHLSG